MKFKVYRKFKFIYLSAKTVESNEVIPDCICKYRKRSARRRRRAARRRRRRRRIVKRIVRRKRRLVRRLRIRLGRR